MGVTRPACDAAYRATTYRVLAPEGAIDLRLGVVSPALAALHRRCAVTGSVLVSAGNPRGVLQVETANRAATTALHTLLQRRGERFVPALGIPDAGDWPAETSVLILGAGRRRAIAWCRLLKQNAVVFTGADAVPHLCWNPRLPA